MQDVIKSRRPKRKMEVKVRDGDVTAVTYGPGVGSCFGRISTHPKATISPD